MVYLGMKRSREEEMQDTQIITNMANYLILLSRGGTTRNQSSDDSSAKRVFECKTCNRKFQSFQALGGHRASHKNSKPRINDADPMVVAKPKKHECSVCGVEFSTGQALGGHMRRHRADATMKEYNHSPPPPPPVVAIPVLKRMNSKRVFSFDLNLTPLENDIDLEFRVGKVVPNEFELFL